MAKADTGEHERSVAESRIELTLAEEAVDELSDRDLSDISDRELVGIFTELKELEDAVESLRKGAVSDELAERVEPGEKLLGLSHIKSHNKYVADDTGEVIMRAVSDGIDYTEFVSINASALADTAPEIAEIGESEYTYFR